MGATTERLNELLGKGLQDYFRGDLRAALQAWEQALALSPNDARAREYVRFARQSLGEAVAPVAPAGPPPPPAPAPPRPAITATRVEPAQAAWQPRPAAPPPPPPPPPPPAHIGWDDMPAAGAAVELAPEDSSGDFDLLVDEPAPPPKAPSPTPEQTRRAEVAQMLKGARELFALADFSGSLELIEKVLLLEPSNGEAQEYLVKNRDTLTQMYESQLGGLEAVPRLAIPPDEIIWLSLDHRAGFVLSQIDGQSTYEDLFSLSGLSRLETARILAKLVGDGVIKVSR